jgi:hypothetical protein
VAALGSSGSSTDELQTQNAIARTPAIACCSTPPHRGELYHHLTSPRASRLPCARADGVTVRSLKGPVHVSRQCSKAFPLSTTPAGGLTSAGSHSSLYLFAPRRYSAIVVCRTRGYPTQLRAGPSRCKDVLPRERSAAIRICSARTIWGTRRAGSE